MMTFWSAMVTTTCSKVGDNDNLQGGGGTDQLFGHSGDDTLKGGVGGTR